MKKLTLAVGVLLAVAGASCSGSDKAPVKAAVTSDSTTSTCNIRYIDIDSVLSAYTLAQELAAQVPHHFAAETAETAGNK